MPGYLVWPSVVITLALVMYSLGVWAERIARNLLRWHVAAFWSGLVFDAYGTWLMDRMVVSGDRPDVFHGVTGLAAFLLMAVHAAWATWVVLRGSDQARRGFHRYSIVVWLIWLVPYFGGMIAGMMKGAGG